MNKIEEAVKRLNILRLVTLTEEIQRDYTTVINVLELFDNMLEEITSAQFTHTSIGNVYTDRRRVYEIVEATQAKYEEIK